MLVITVLLLVFLLILFVLFTAIGLTFKLKVLSLEEKKELRGVFTVKWLLFSHTFSIEEPGESESFPEEPKKSDEDKTVKGKQSEIDLNNTEKVRVTIEPQDKAEVKKKREVEEKEVEEKRIEMGEGEEKRIEDSEKKEKRTEVGEENEKRTEVGERKEKLTEGDEKKEKWGIISKIRGKKKPEIEEAPEEMTPREMLHWGLEAFRSLRKPLFRLFSDLLNGIKIKRLESNVTFGLSDPADTGMLCGLLHSIAGLAYSRCRHCSFSINPVFMNPMMDFRGDIEIRVRAYSLIFPMLKFMFNRKTLSFTYSIIKEKLWGKRKFSS
ncbi:hypothetical protein MSKOL_3061 [Methanosarcina sp. Kolksee]|uniref:DUF2953 domain-containing protein n=1 Tax=Methanosarcina sp. Kolksee TaxID=1434099 RepID=UPI00061606F7|nr:DUF2953 domain-containing protein [Methanosarcina sp. Kolksee]AKB48838.1 hypothetical protein MSKOL_3061 [Methanosarcina sp. Kolksee]